MVGDPNAGDTQSRGIGGSLDQNALDVSNGEEVGHCWRVPGQRGKSKMTGAGRHGDGEELAGRDGVRELEKVLQAYVTTYHPCRLFLSLPHSNHG